MLHSAIRCPVLYVCNVDVLNLHVYPRVIAIQYCEAMASIAPVVTDSMKYPLPAVTTLPVHAVVTPRVGAVMTWSTEETTQFLHELRGYSDRFCEAVDTRRRPGVNMMTTAFDDRGQQPNKMAGIFGQDNRHNRMATGAYRQQRTNRNRISGL